MKTHCCNEVLELHRFFQEWFAGRLASTPEAFARFADVIESGFEIVSPDGECRARAALLESLRAAHGCDPEARIRIENFRGHEVGEGLFQAVYEEWQGRGADQRGRLSSALFRRAEGLPQGVEWLHLHECWLPAVGSQVARPGTDR